MQGRINNELGERLYNLFIFSHLASNINSFIFNCLTLNRHLLFFNCLTSNFCFFKNIYFSSRREQLFVDMHPYFWILNSLCKMMTCYLWGTNKFLRYHSPCTSIPHCGFPTKSIKLTRFKFFEVFRVSQTWGTSV